MSRGRGRPRKAEMLARSVEVRQIPTPTQSDYSDQIGRMVHRAMSHLQPPPRLSLADYAEQRFRLPSEFSAVGGQFSFDLTPYLRGICDAISDPAVERISWVASAQVAKTTLLLILAAYHIEQDPTSMLFIEPSEKLVKGIATERFNAITKDNPGLRRIFDDKANTDNIYTKLFPGGSLVFGSANSVSDLISRPIRILVLDEVDSYSVDLKQKGNPIRMAESRTNTYHNRKILTVSTPGVEGMSNVMDAYDSSDMRVYQVPCPKCGQFQELKFAQIRKGQHGWLDAFYECEHCGHNIPEQAKPEMVRAGKWIATASDPAQPRHAGFRINQLYSLFPNTTWGSIGQRLSMAKAKNDINDLKTFTNEVLAETWNDQHLGNISDHELAQRAKLYPAEVPLGVGMLTAGVDFQADRCEVSVLGWGRDRHTWVIEHKVIYGDCSTDPDSQNATLWRELDAYLNRPFRHESGRKIYIRTAYLDVGDGTRTHTIRKFCFQRHIRGIHACVGKNQGPIWSGQHSKDHRNRKPIYWVGVTSAKDDLYHRLRQTNPELAGYIHFSQHLPPHYYAGLTSERLVERRESGILKRKYEPRSAAVRNEPIDCWSYAVAAFTAFMGRNLDTLDRLCDAMAQPPEQSLAVQSETITEPSRPQETPIPVPAPQPPAPKPQPKKAFDFFAVKNQARRY